MLLLNLHMDGHWHEQCRMYGEPTLQTERTESFCLLI